MKCFNCRSEAIGVCSLCSCCVCENCSALYSQRLYCLRKECKKHHDNTFLAIFFTIIIIMFGMFFILRVGYNITYGLIIIVVALFFNFKYFLYDKEKK
ncbi:MAG: hypothetical protein HEEMFOPI_01923 [Holosporales bacterium]